MAGEIWLAFAFLAGVGVYYLKEYFEEWESAVVIMVGMLFSAVLFMVTTQSLLVQTLRSGLTLDPALVATQGAIEGVLSAFLYILGFSLTGKFKEMKKKP